MTYKDLLDAIEILRAAGRAVAGRDSLAWNILYDARTILYDQQKALLGR